MSVLERMDTAINTTLSEGAEIIELELTPEDYAELMKFAADMPPESLEGLQLDLQAQTYRGFSFEVLHGTPVSGILTEEGADRLPYNNETDGHITSERQDN
ncbi:MAG: hypothetical protein AAGC58_05360 [Asticcacaulis sp.]